jgi:two-component system, chemotaxis family, chemotaxis protein CheY
MKLEKNIKILVVDDFKNTRKIIRFQLRSLGYSEVIEADNGEEALQLLQETTVNLVISDWNMPVMTGYQLLQNIRKDKSLSKIPFIMITAEGQPDSIIKAIRAGTSQYIIKPFTLEILKEKLGKL